LLAPFLEQLVNWIADQAPVGSPYHFQFFVTGSLVIVLVGFICGSIGTIVVGNRMAFFGDALAHCAFAGIGIALLFAILAGVDREHFDDRWKPLFLVATGVIFGVFIAFVHENTSLSRDTVIGVFFALALGLGGMVMKAVAGRRFFNLESFLFGDPISATTHDLEILIFLALLTAIYLYFMYNNIVFASFNVSLAKSRGVRTRLALYSFIILLGIIVNLCLLVVGVLLINGLLIVPAATAANLSRNMRQLFWFSIGISIFVGLCGMLLAWQIELPDPANPMAVVHFGASGTTLVLSVILFFASMGWRKLQLRA